jgi:uncharacterized protein
MAVNDEQASEIIVQGSAEARTMPDRAVIRITIEGEGNDRDGAYQQAARSAAGVDEVIDNRSSAIDRSTTTALVVHPKTRWRRGENVRTGWRATRTTHVEVTGLDVLGDLIAELATSGGAVDGPYWQLDRTNAIHTDVRRMAAEDARARAEGYAAALGLTISGIAWVAEPGLRGGGTNGGTYAFTAMTPAMAGAGGAPVEPEIIEVAPEELTVSAAVEVGFRFA